MQTTDPTGIFNRNKLSEEFSNVLPDEARLKLDAILLEIQTDFPESCYSLEYLNTKFRSFLTPQSTCGQKLESLFQAAAELTTAEAPKWEFIAARLLYFQFSFHLKQEETRRELSDFYKKLVYLTRQNLYGSYILEHYSREELLLAETYLKAERNNLFTFSGLDLLLKRYVIRTHDHIPLESPQEMFLGIALHLAMNERNDRMLWVKKFYDMLSRLEVTMATPTLSNARKPYHQLSSCFIDTVPDSLEGIYRSIDNFAQVSKFGGGMGMYFGKVRASGSNIRGFEGAAGGVIRWIRLVNDTAVAVDQLGMRQGAVAVYLDVWHRDLPEFLQLRTNNGDDRMKAHDVFPAVCYPDLFWKMAKEDLDQNWYLMCPHEIFQAKGYHLEDYFGEEWERRYLDCVQDARISKRTVTLKDIIRLVLRSAAPWAAARMRLNLRSGPVCAGAAGAPWARQRSRPAPGQPAARHPDPCACHSYHVPVTPSSASSFSTPPDSTGASAMSASPWAGVSAISRATFISNLSGRCTSGASASASNTVA